MIWLSLIIPVILSILGYVYLINVYPKYHNTDNMILFIPTIICTVILGIMYSCMIYDNISDTEYLTYYYTKIRHYDSWNERVRKTKTRTVYVNGKPHKETYTVYETVNHPEDWCAYLNNNHNISISEKEFNRIKSLWKSPEIFVDMHRSYHTKDGDAQDYMYNHNKQHIQIYTKSHNYINPIIGTESQFKYNEISKDEAKELGLYEYPEVKKHEQNPIIGYTKYVSKQNIKNIKYLNAIYGYNKQITFFILIYPNTSVSIIEDQKSYWQGGNKNEFIVCVGIDSISNNVQWAECFSWQDDITYDVNCKNYITKMHKFDIDKLSVWLNNNIHLWKRKSFKDFNYLDVKLSATQECIILIVIIICALISVGYFIIQNNQ